MRQIDALPKTLPSSKSLIKLLIAKHEALAQQTLDSGDVEAHNYHLDALEKLSQKLCSIR